MHPFAQVLLTMGAVALLMLVKPCEAQDVKYCKNYETGEIIVIEAGYPCPSPTVEL